jgi:Kef-type K+ transport system membrane component KefB
MGGAAITVGLAFGYIAFMFLVARPLLARIASRTTRDVITHNKVAIIVLCLLVSSLVTELIGIHALFGAFLFGVILPKEGDLTVVLAEKLEELVLVALLPLFFAYSGVRTQLGLLNTPSGWAICALIIFVACIGKFGASAVAARVTGLSWRESSVLGILMNTRGLMELIVLNIGLDLGVIGPELFTMMVIMALVTTFMTSPLVRWLYPARLQTADLGGAAAVTSARP